MVNDGAVQALEDLDLDGEIDLKWPFACCCSGAPEYGTAQCHTHGFIQAKRHLPFLGEIWELWVGVNQRPVGGSM